MVTTVLQGQMWRVSVRNVVSAKNISICSGWYFQSTDRAREPDSGPEIDILAPFILGKAANTFENISAVYARVGIARATIARSRAILDEPPAQARSQVLERPPGLNHHQAWMKCKRSQASSQVIGQPDIVAVTVSDEFAGGPLQACISDKTRTPHMVDLHVNELVRRGRLNTGEHVGSLIATAVVDDDQFDRHTVKATLAKHAFN